MSELVFLLEEPSAREMLKGFLPKVLPADVECRYIIFQGKQDMEKRLGARLRGYANPQAKFLVLRDKDSSDCTNVKAALQTICRAADKAHAIVRIACHELESWYLGDLAAVEQAFPNRKVARHQAGKKYRQPDQLANPSQELSRLVPEYQKVSGSRSIGPHLSVAENHSHSFGVFVQTIVKLAPLMSGDQGSGILAG